jgi:hypothetical protein
VARTDIPKSDTPKQEIPKSDVPKRRHRATYARDKRIGGYLIRVAGPFSERMVGMEVPVTLKDGTEHQEKLLSLIWGGVDKETGDKVALYRFESRPREVETVEF